MTNSIGEVKDNDVLFLIGTNTAENHPVIWYQMVRALQRGAKLIVADPRKIEPARRADVFLQLKPGTNIALINGLINVIISEKLYDADYVSTNTEHFHELAESVAKYTPEYVAEITAVPAEYIRSAARTYAAGQRAGIYYAMGITQHATGTKTVQALSNLALLCGNIGKEFAGLNPLRGQNNVQGACDMGALPDVLPGYQKVENPQVREKFAKAWGVELSAKPGLCSTEVTHAIADGKIKGLFIMGENIMVSDPDVQHVDNALRKLDFLVVQDIFRTETAEMADVVLPATCFAEKDGTFTNTERRVQRVRKAVEAPGEAWTDWKILSEIMVRLGNAKRYTSADEIMAEIAAVTPQYGGISYSRLETEGLQWPCPDNSHPGTKYLHHGHVIRGKGLFVPVEHEGAKERPDKQYPLTMTTGRILYHYHTRTMTGRVEGLEELAPSSFVEVNEKTAERLGIEHGELVRVVSRRGALTTTVRVTDRIREEVVFIPFHFAEGNANILTNTALDPTSKTAELKVAAVRIEKL